MKETRRDVTRRRLKKTVANIGLIFTAVVVIWVLSGFLKQTSPYALDTKDLALINLKGADLQWPKETVEERAEVEERMEKRAKESSIYSIFYELQSVKGGTSITVSIIMLVICIITFATVSMYWCIANLLLFYKTYLKKRFSKRKNIFSSI